MASMATRTHRRSNFVGDRFIPVRAAMDLDYAYAQLTGGFTSAARPVTRYQEVLANATFGNNRRILRFNNNPIDVDGSDIGGSQEMHRNLQPDRTLDAWGLADDDRLNLLDWGSRNVIAIAMSPAISMEDTLYLWSAFNGSTNELVTVSEDVGPITSVSWAPDGRRLAIGLNNSQVQIWDTMCKSMVRRLDGLDGFIGSLAWNNSNILTTGGEDGKVTNFDMRTNSYVAIYQGHSQEVCGLEWCGSGRKLASGGKDNLVHIWDMKMASRPWSRNYPNQWLHRFSEHKGGVRALAWCPLQSDLLATGGGESDGCIRFWDTSMGTCTNSVQLDSQVCGLLWSNSKTELLSSSGIDGNQVTIRKYPLMFETATLSDHIGRVLYMAQSPDGCDVATASGADEKLMLWKNVFPSAPKSSKGNPSSQFMNAHTLIR